MNSNSTLRVLALFLFAISGVAAFCLGALAYTFATGELPFDLQPMIAMPNEQAPVTPAPERKPLELQDLRPQEEHAVQVFREIERERSRLAAKEQQLQEREKAFLILADNAKHLQSQLQDTEVRVRKLLVQIDQNEIENVKGLAKLIGQLNQQQGADMLAEMDDDMIARILYYMDDKNAGKVLSALMQSGGPAQSKRAATIAEKMHRLTDQLEPPKP